MTELITYFSKEDARKIEQTLDRLLPHINTNNSVIVGGLPIRYHFKRLNIPFTIRPGTDLDVVIENETDMLETIKEDFLIRHYHPTHKNKEINDPFKFFFSLSAKETKIKVDLFANNPYPVLDKEPVSYKGKPIYISSLEDQLATSMLEISRILGGKRIRPKNLNDVTLMLKATDIAKAQTYFEKKPGIQEDTKDRSSIEKTYKEITAKMKGEPDLVGEWDTSTRPPVCPACEKNNPKFPLSPIKEPSLS